jgi:hypothetical protein
MAASERSPDVCGAAGCRATTGLMRVEIGTKGARVLCSECRGDLR